LREGAVGLASSSNLLAASILVEIAPGRPATLYLLPARSVEVKPPSGAGGLMVPLPLAAVELPVRSGSAEASWGG